jgi:ubiquinone biosynthesis monooxygenase Coq7
MKKPTFTRKLTGLDQLILGLDRVVRTVSQGSTKAERQSPAENINDPLAIETLSIDEKKHIGGLMRINHTGEVCAQALYQGQAITARSASVRTSMESSAKEEEDHLAWCEQRLKELGSRTSVLNPLFYGLSFSIGALAGVAGDKWSLGFVAATEEQVCHHLRDHLEQIPEHDQKSRAILTQMLSDEEHHGNLALSVGGTPFTPPAKKLMSAISKAMTKTTYRI